jgi:hypothetical protein
MIIAEENETIKLHVANLQRSSIALHIHGHKATITALDGVELSETQQITRDVFDISPAQRTDLRLQTKDDGLHSYGPGLWMFHDHVPTGTTTDGMEPGGNMAILAYKHYLDELGMPKMHDELFDQVFNKDYYAKKQAVWNSGDFAALLGDAGLVAPNYSHIILFGLLAGLIIALLVFSALIIRRKQP